MMRVMEGEFCWVWNMRSSFSEVQVDSAKYWQSPGSVHK